LALSRFGPALLALLALAVSGRGAWSDADPARVALEAREAIAVIDWFYVQHRACPQPSRPGELDDLIGGLGDGFSVEKRGQFVEIRGISGGKWTYDPGDGTPERPLTPARQFE
jgi:hypothetical protein